MKKLLIFLKTRVRGALYAFAALADVSQSPKLSGLYSDGQNLSTYLNSIFKVAISAGAILAVLRLGYAGYLYMGSDLLNKKAQAREMIQDVFIGLFLLLSVYIILSQINPDILKLNIAITPVSVAAPAATTPATASANQAKLDAILADENRMRSLFMNRNININFNAGACTSLTQLSGCTNVGLLPSNVVNQLDSLQRTCNCGLITISGGTEFWMHNTHGPGLAVVDLRRFAALDQYIMANGTRTTSATFKSGQTTDIYTLNGGTYYAEDSAHWHVVY